MEYFDHIDEEDNVIGRVRADEAHYRFLLHRSVAVLIETPDGKIVLQHRKRDKLSFPLFMTASAAGHVKAGQSYEEAALMELREELGIETKLKFIGKFRQYVPEVENEIGAVFLGKSEGPFADWEEEAEGLLYFTRDELDRLMVKHKAVFTPSCLDAYQLLRGKEEAGL